MPCLNLNLLQPAVGDCCSTKSLVSGQQGEETREENCGLTGLGGASLDGLSVDTQTHLRAGCQRETVQRVRFETVHSVGASWVEGHMYLKGFHIRQKDATGLRQPHTSFMS